MTCSPGLGVLVTTTSSHPTEETLPSSDLEARCQSLSRPSLLFARGGKISCTDVGTTLAPEAIKNVAAAEKISVVSDDPGR